MRVTGKLLVCMEETKHDLETAKPQHQQDIQRVMGVWEQGADTSGVAAIL